MPITTLGDVYNQEALSSYLIEDPVEQTAFFQSGVIATNGVITELAQSASNVINVPFWRRLDTSIEPNYSNDVYTDIAEPLAVNTGVQTARTAYLNQGFGSADLVAELNRTDPLRYVAGALNDHWRVHAEKRVIATALGIYNENVAGTGDMVVNAGAAIDANVIIDAQQTMGDRGDMAAVAMHSYTFGQLRKQQLIDYETNAENNTRFAVYGGARVIVDDEMPVFGTGAERTFLTIFFNAGAIGYGEGSPKVPLEYDRQPDRANGGGTEVLWTRKTMILHPFGYAFTSDVITGNAVESNPMSASWSDLANAANWERVVDRKNVPMAFLLTTV